MDTTTIIRITSLVLLCGCGTPSAWQLSRQEGSREEFNSARLSYPVRDRVNGVGVEMVYTLNSFRTYLEVHSQIIPPHLGNPKEAAVRMKTPLTTICAIAHRHQGGQRLSLPQELHDTLVSHLLQGTPVTIELVGYSTTLQPSDFAIAYQKMQKKSLNIPIQIPFKL